MELLKDFEEQLIKIEQRLNPESTHTGECLQCTELAETVYALVEELKPKWINVSYELPEEGIPVLGYNKEWVDDGNSTGIRECFWNADEYPNWTTAYWNFGWDEYRTRYDTPTHWMKIEKPENFI